MSEQAEFFYSTAAGRGTEDEAAAWANPFADVFEPDWFYGDVEYVHTNGLFSGTSGTTFASQTEMSRAMLHQFWER